MVQREMPNITRYQEDDQNELDGCPYQKHPECPPTDAFSDSSKVRMAKSLTSTKRTR